MKHNPEPEFMKLIDAAIEELDINSKAYHLLIALKCQLTHYNCIEMPCEIGERVIVVWNQGQYYFKGDLGYCTGYYDGSCSATFDRDDNFSQWNFSNSFSSGWGIIPYSEEAHARVLKEVAEEKEAEEIQKAKYEAIRLEKQKETDIKNAKNQAIKKVIVEMFGEELGI